MTSVDPVRSLPKGFFSLLLSCAVSNSAGNMFHPSSKCLARIDFSLSGKAKRFGDRTFYLTRIAYFPGVFIVIFFAISELLGSMTTTNPVQSSLRFVDLQFGQIGPALINRQFLQAFSTKPISPLWVRESSSHHP